MDGWMDRWAFNVFSYSGRSIMVVQEQFLQSSFLVPRGSVTLDLFWHIWWMRCGLPGVDPLNASGRGCCHMLNISRLQPFHVPPGWHIRRRNDNNTCSEPHQWRRTWSGRSWKQSRLMQRHASKTEQMYFKNNIWPSLIWRSFWIIEHSSLGTCAISWIIWSFHL